MCTTQSVRTKILAPTQSCTGKPPSQTGGCADEAQEARPLLHQRKVTDANPNPNPNPDPNPNPYPYQVTDAGCKALVAAIRSGALPALNGLELEW